jgi:hypothetical protein
MSNNLALFVTHHVFLTDNQISQVVSGSKVSCEGCCVPVWVDAASGKTTEPAKEIFCSYELSASDGGPGSVEFNKKMGYKVLLPRASEWKPPKEIDFESLSSLSAEERALILRDRDEWWFRNPKPMDIQDLSRGYLRFDVKNTDLKIGRRKYSSHHVVEISSVKRLENSLTG